jgi:hypothetical protein
MGVRIVQGVRTHGFYGVGQKKYKGRGADRRKVADTRPKWFEAAKAGALVALKNRLFNKGGETGALVQVGHQKYEPGGGGKAPGIAWKGTQPERPEVMAQKPGTIFSLTGGLVPTFTQDFPNKLGSKYKAMKQGMVVINESLSLTGPGPQMMRGNHVWYNYAMDYMDTLGKIGDETEKGGGLTRAMRNNPAEFWENKNSIYPKLLQDYQKSAAKYSKPLLKKWRDQISTKMKNELINRSKSSEGDSGLTTGQLAAGRGGTSVQAAEERAPKLLAKLHGKNIENLEAQANKETRGGGMSIDTVVKIGGRIYKVEHTQSKTTEKSTHSMMGKWMIDVDAARRHAKGFEEGLKAQALVHYEKSEKAINLMFADVNKVVNKLAKKKEYKGLDARDILKKAKMVAGDKVTRDNLVKMFKNAANVEIKDFAQRKYLKESFEEVLHILTQVWAGGSSSPNDPKGKEGDIFSDIAVGELPRGVGKGGGVVDENQLNQFAVGPIWEVKTMAEIGGGGEQTQAMGVALLDVFIKLKYENFYDWIMGSDTMLKLGNTERKRIIEQLNIIDMYESMKLGGSRVVLGQAIEGARGAIYSQYLVAGGVASFEDSEMNKQLGQALGDFIDATDITKQGGFPQEIHTALQKGVTQAKSFQKNFVPPSTVSTERQETNDANIAQGQAIQDRAAAVSPETVWDRFNNALRTYTWATPYVGAYYQAGGSSGKEQLRSGIGGL